MTLSPAPSKLQILRDVFGFPAFRPGQEAVMDAVLGGRQCAVGDADGIGKIAVLSGAGLDAGRTDRGGVAVGGADAGPGRGAAAGRRRGRHHQFRHRIATDNVAAWRRAASGETRLLYLSPERLMTDAMLAALAKLPVRLIAIDEAHCISQWGPAFRPNMKRCRACARLFPGVPIVALTATADETTRADIAARLFGGDAEQIVLGFDRPNITLDGGGQSGLEAAAAGFRHSARPGQQRHRLLPVAQANRGSRRVPGQRMASPPWPIMPA